MWNCKRTYVSRILVKHAVGIGVRGNGHLCLGGFRYIGDAVGALLRRRSTTAGRGRWNPTGRGWWNPVARLINRIRNYRLISFASLVRSSAALLVVVLEKHVRCIPTPA
jgi:hypothetical protein